MNETGKDTNRQTLCLSVCLREPRQTDLETVRRRVLAGAEGEAARRWLNLQCCEMRKISRRTAVTGTPGVCLLSAIEHPSDNGDDSQFLQNSQETGSKKNQSSKNHFFIPNEPALWFLWGSDYESGDSFLIPLATSAIGVSRDRSLNMFVTVTHWKRRGLKKTTTLFWRGVL